MILVVGATGTVGRRVVEALLSSQIQEIRVLVRGRNDWEESLLPAFRRRGIDTVVGDVRSVATVRKAVSGCKAIINCSGAMRSSPGFDLESVNIDGVKNLIEEGQKSDVQRFIQLSCMGATEHSTSLYFACKWDAEQLLRDSDFYWTIFRPSLIFDSEGSLNRIMKFWVQRLPFLLVAGSGLNRFQPIAAEDVAACIVKSIYDRETVGKTYELPGPQVLDLEALLERAAEQYGRSARKLRVPSFLALPLAALLGRLFPDFPVDNNVLQVLTSEMTGDAGPMLEKFNLQRQSFGKPSRALSGRRSDGDERAE